MINTPTIQSRLSGRSRRSASGKALAASAICFCLTVPAQEAARCAPASSGGGSSLQMALKHYSTMSSFQATMRTTTTLQPLNGSQPNVINSTLSLAFKNPNLMRIQSSGLMGDTLVVSDGKTLSSYLGMTNQYSVSPAPKRSLNTFLMAANVNGATKLNGHVRVNGRTLDTYQTKTSVHGQSATTTIFVDPAERTIDHVIVVLPKISGPQGGGVRVTTEEEFQAQRFNPPLSPALFRFSPPAGAQRGSGAGAGTILGLPSGGTP